MEWRYGAGKRKRAERDAPGSLAMLRSGDCAVIESIADDHARAVALRFGMGAGACVRCVSATRGGPVVLSCGRQEIAVGHALARRIAVCSEVPAL